MNIKKVLANALKKSADNVVAKNAASFAGYGVEEMPKSLKDNR